MSRNLFLYRCKEGAMDPKVEKKIGQNLRALRESAKLTQEELSAKMQLQGCDLTRSALAKIEVGQRHLYPDEIRVFKQVLNTNYDAIFQISED